MENISRTRQARRKKRTSRKKGGSILRRIGSVVWGFTRLVVMTGIFFVLLVGASYSVLGYFIRGDVIVAPNVIARPVNEALAVLAKDDLYLELDFEEPSDTLAEGEILSQHPKPGTKVKKRTAIRVVISSGNRQVTLPEELIGLNRLEAGIRLRTLGLEVGNTAYLRTVGPEGDIVLAIDPPPGTGVPPGSPINLLVSSQS